MKFGKDILSGWAQHGKTGYNFFRSLNDKKSHIGLIINQYKYCRSYTTDQKALWKIHGIELFEFLGIDDLIAKQCGREDYSIRYNEIEQYKEIIDKYLIKYNNLILFA